MESTEQRQKIEAWKKNTWLDFCKAVMKADQRYTLFPLADYHNASYDQREAGVFGPMCLRRDGALADVYLMPPLPKLGLNISAGSKYSNMQFSGYPSESLVYPALRLADELERQFVREVNIEATKHGNRLESVRKARTYGRATRRTVKHSYDSHKLPASVKADGQQSNVD